MIYFCLFYVSIPVWSILLLDVLLQLIASVEVVDYIVGTIVFVRVH